VTQLFISVVLAGCDGLAKFADAVQLLLYVIDNEVHHRAQGFVYLRALGVEPPPFYDR
jgi:hypothetical protein